MRTTNLLLDLNSTFNKCIPTFGPPCIMTVFFMTLTHLELSGDQSCQASCLYASTFARVNCDTPADTHTGVELCFTMVLLFYGSMLFCFYSDTKTACQQYFWVEKSLTSKSCLIFIDCHLNKFLEVFLRHSSL